jgi:hypothetical protein
MVVMMPETEVSSLSRHTGHDGSSLCPSPAHFCFNLSFVFLGELALSACCKVQVEYVERGSRPMKEAPEASLDEAAYLDAAYLCRHSCFKYCLLF